MVQKNKTYVEIYQGLIADMKKSEFTINIMWSFIFVSLAAFIFSVLTMSDGFEILATVTGIVATSILTVFVISHLMAVLQSMSTAENQSRRVTANLLLKTSKPYMPEKSGLSFEEVQSIRNLAEAHQGAADWRGNVVGLIAVFLLTVLFYSSETFNYVMASISHQEGNSSVLQNCENNNDTANNLIAFYNLFIVPVLNNPRILIPQDFAGVNRIWLILLVVIFSLVLVLRFYRYYRSFWQEEVPNRAIIYGCIEAEALLQHLALEAVEEYTIEQKIMLAKALNCVSSEISYPKNAILFAEPNKYWYLEDMPIGAKLITTISLKVKSISIPSPVSLLRKLGGSIKAKFQLLQSAYQTRTKSKKKTRRRR